MAQEQASKSQLEQVRAQATQSKASVDVAAVNLERTIIRAPIEGVVVSRNVDVGQTVAASLQAPTLFLIAQDLTKMQVLADVDEADVGQLNPDSKVSFTVDAFPTETFQGKISQSRHRTWCRTWYLHGRHLCSESETAVEAGHDCYCDGDSRGVAGCPGGTQCGAAFRPATTQVQAVTPAVEIAGRVRPAATAQPLQLEGTELPVRVRLGMTDGVSTEVIRR